MTKSLRSHIREKFFNRYSITLWGLGGGSLFAAICWLFYLLDHGETILLFLYSAGLFFGIAMFFALRTYTDEVVSVTIFSALEYIIMIFFSMTDLAHPDLRRLGMGGAGALLFLGSLQLTSEIRFRLSDYLAGFLGGIAATFYMWTDNFTSFDPWLTILAIVVWQTWIAAIINRRILLTKS